MITKSNEYKAAINAPARTVFYKAAVDIIDPDIVYGSVISSSADDYSKSAQVHDGGISGVKYATLEANRWALDGTYNIYPDSAIDLKQEVGYQSGELSSSDSTFSTAQYVEMQFSGVSVLQACSIYFSGNQDDGHPIDFTVDIKVSGDSAYSKSFTYSASNVVTLTGFTVNNPDAIRVTVTKWSKPSRRMRVVEISPGTVETWTQDELAAIDIKQQIDTSNTSLPYGSCALVLDNKDRRFEPRKKGGLFQSIEDRQPLPISFGLKLPDGSIDWTQVGVYYQYSGGWKTGNNGLTIQWDLVDIVGLLADRVYIVPETMPATVSGWVADIVSQLGVNFAGRYYVDSSISSTSAFINSAADLSGVTCGDMIRYLCQAAGAFPRADSETGYLAIEPFWNNGNTVGLDQMSKYPVMKANEDVAYIQFTLYNDDKTVYNISGNNTAASTTISVQNPFIHTEAQAITAAKQILQSYGGNRIEITERGDMSNELGDVDSIQLDESSATSARRIQQSFTVTDGVLKNLPAVFIQPSGFFMYNTSIKLTGSGTWTAPAGVTSIGLIIVGGGNGGANGSAGTWDEAGGEGADGAGAKIWSSQVSINSGQTFTYSAGTGGAIGADGAASTFGTYSSENGSVFANGYTDINDGGVYGRPGIISPAYGSGDGGKGGAGGEKGNKHEETATDGTTYSVIDNYPGSGASGVAGADGCIIVFYAGNTSDVDTSKNAVVGTATVGSAEVGTE